MPSFGDPDLAALKARYESNYALVTNDPKIASDPVIIAALAKAKASEVEVGRVSALPPSRYSRREGPRQTSRRCQGSLS